MTNEEAIANINMIRVAFVDHVTKEQRKLIDDTLDTAIKALEQQPCERFEWGIDGKVYKITKAKDGKEICQQVCDDAISRKTLLTNLYQYKISCAGRIQAAILEVEELVEKMPSVTQKSGKWIKMPLTETGQTYSYECSLCGRRILATDVGLSEFPYCHCGARMESEEKE